MEVVLPRQRNRPKHRLPQSLFVAVFGQFLVIPALPRQPILAENWENTAPRREKLRNSAGFRHFSGCFFRPTDFNHQVHLNGQVNFPHP